MNVQNLHPAEVREQFGRAVSAARHKRRLTQEQAADLLGMSRRKLLDIEAGRIELARYEKAGILDVLAADTTPADARLAGRMDGCSDERFTHLHDGNPVVLCGVMLTLDSGDALSAWWRDQVRPLKGKPEWPSHLLSIRTVVFQFDHFRPRLARIHPILTHAQIEHI